MVRRRSGRLSRLPTPQKRIGSSVRACSHILFLIVLSGVIVACTSPDAESYYRRGRQLREEGKPVAAMEAFIASTRVPSREYAIKGRSWSNMATMCRMGEQHQSAYALYEQSALQFGAAHDSLAFAYALNNMAWEQAVQGNKDAAVRLVDSALTVCADEAVQRKVTESLAAACLYAEEYDSVLVYTQDNASESVYFAILRAQAYSFLGQSDSAVFYARQVLAETDNGRYLDDVYYMLMHSDIADIDSVRCWASTRSDIQGELERNQPEWIEAMLIAEKALEPQPDSANRRKGMLWGGIIIALMGIGAAILLCRRRWRSDSFDKQCLALRHSTRLRDELHWDNYLLFTDACNKRLSGIVDKLTQKGLSEREIRICVLVLIGFSYAEMADILFRAENGIGKDKYVIAKHLGVSAKDLQNKLKEIANEN